MRKPVITLALVAAFAVHASPALAATPSTLSFAGRYTVASTQWTPTNNTVATTHSEAASKTGAVRAKATAAGGRAPGWSAISAAVVSQSATVEPSELGYRVAVTFTGVSGSSSGLLPEGSSIGTGPVTDTAAALGVGVRLSGECTSTVPCNDSRHVVTSESSETVTVTFDYPAVAVRSTMIVRASAQAWIKTPTNGDSGADSATIAATVTSIKIAPIG